MSGYPQRLGECLVYLHGSLENFVYILRVLQRAVPQYVANFCTFFALFYPHLGEQCEGPPRQRGKGGRGGLGARLGEGKTRVS